MFSFVLYYFVYTVCHGIYTFFTEARRCGLTVEVEARLECLRGGVRHLTNANSLRRRCTLALALASVGRAAPGPKAKRHSVSSAPHRRHESCDLLRLFGCAYLLCRTSIPRGRRAQGRLHLGRGPL